MTKNRDCPHPAELAMKRKLDGTFQSVNRFSGEIHEVIVPKTWLPPYHDDQFWGTSKPKEAIPP